MTVNLVASFEKILSQTLKRIFVQNFYQLDKVIFWRKETVNDFWANQF